MRIEDLAKILACKRSKVLEKVNVLVSYILFRVSLCSYDEIPGVGRVEISQDNKEVIIKLDEKWVNLLNDDSCEEEILKYLMEIIDV